MLQQVWRKYKKLLRDYRSRISVEPTLTSLECCNAISKAIQDKTPYLAARMGWLEACCIGTLLSDQMTELSLRERLELHAGVYPATAEQVALFSDIYLEALREVDLLGLMKGPFEGWLVKSYAPQVMRVALSDLEPYFHDEPWSQYLEGLKVLVIHPFEESILKQYTTVRRKIFANPKILPQFELSVIKAPQTITGNPREYDSWTTTLKALEQKIEREKFDVAVLGCGAYGLPLGATIKKMGKIAIHLGGATQLLFGIGGGRWRSKPRFQKFINDSWSNPLIKERSMNYEKIEEGAYW